MDRAERGCDFQILVRPLYKQLDRRARFELPDRLDKFLPRMNGLGVDLEDEVLRLEAGLLRGRIGFDLVDGRPAGSIEEVNTQLAADRPDAAEGQAHDSQG